MGKGKLKAEIWAGFLKKSENRGWRFMIKAIYYLGAVNLLITLACFRDTSHSYAATNDGFLAAIIATFCMGFSVLLTGFGVLSMVSETQKKRFILRSLVATLLAAAPLVVYFVESQRR